MGKRRLARHGTLRVRDLDYKLEGVREGGSAPQANRNRQAQ
jgi:hypothetical protein